MATNTEGNIFDQEPDNTLRDRLVSDEENVQSQSPAPAPATAPAPAPSSAPAPNRCCRLHNC